MRILTIIPARGGSKSLPKKNILPLKGKPMLCHSVVYSLKCPIVEQTVVSTDCREIADIAMQCGASVPFIRPDEFAQDDTPDYPVIRHALDYFESNGQQFDVYLILRPTSPFRPANLIERAIAILNNHPDATSVRSVAKIKEHPYRSWKINKDGSMTGLVEEVIEPYNIPRQTLPELYFQTGDLEAVTRNALLRGSVTGEKAYPLVIKHEEMIDIDSKADFDRAVDKTKNNNE